MVVYESPQDNSPASDEEMKLHDYTKQTQLKLQKLITILEVKSHLCT